MAVALGMVLSGTRTALSGAKTALSTNLAHQSCMGHARPPEAVHVLLKTKPARACMGECVHG